MSETVLWQRWDCVDCGHAGISCEHNACPECSHRRTFEEFDARYLPGDARVADAAQVARLKAAGISWFCTICRADNPGDQKQCHHCEAPRGASEQWLRDNPSWEAYKVSMDPEEGDDGATAMLVEQLGEYAGQRAAAGLSFNPSIPHDQQLKASVKGRDPRRVNVDASRPEWEPSALPSSQLADDDGEGEGASSTRPAYLQRLERGWRELRDPAQRRKVVIGTVALCVLAALGVLGWGLLTYDVPGRVDGLEWEQTERVDTWTRYTAQGWLHELTPAPSVAPTNGSGEVAGVEILSCHTAHYADESYVCGRQTVCHDETVSVPSGTTQECSMVDNGNGSVSRQCETVTTYTTRTERVCGEEDKYCTRPIYRDKCSYASWRWAKREERTERGVGEVTRWPELEVGSLERRRRSGRYVVIVRPDEAGGKLLRWKTSDAQEWSRWHVEQPVVARVRNLGFVAKLLTPAEVAAER